MIETIIRNYTIESRRKIVKYVDKNLANKLQAYLWFLKLVALKYMKGKNYLELDLTSQASIEGAMEKLVVYMPDVFEYTSVDQALTQVDFQEEEGVIKALDQLPASCLEEIETIGWIYQYYRSVRKSQVLKEIKKNKKVEKEDIGAVTQLFTPKWIVQYLVENSVGKIYLERNNNQDFKASMDYYVDTEPMPKRALDIENIRVLDPAMGTGHILVYVFDLLYKIYRLEDYPEDKIAQSILEKNIFGFDLDICSEILSKFSLYMKAREVDEDIFSKKINFNLFSFQEPSGQEDKKSQLNQRARQDLDYIYENFRDAKNLGSIIRLDQEIDFDNLNSQDLVEEDRELVRQASLLKSSYHILIANPPYMGKRNMNQDLASYVNENYPRGKADLSTVFMEIQDQLLMEDGIMAMINPHSWMFLSSFKELRKALARENTISSLLHLGPRLFDQADVGTVVQVVAFIMEKRKLRGYQGNYYDLVDYESSYEKQEAFLLGSNCYQVDLDIYSQLDQHPFAYWMSQKVMDVFTGCEKLGQLYTVKQGMSTSNNKRFLRLWHEVDREKIGFNMETSQQAQASGKKWFPYNKGGKFRKWYGNNDIVINYENNGQEIVDYTSKLPQGSWVRIKSRDYYFKESISWPYITSIKNFGPRLIEKGFIFDVAGPSIFIPGDDKYYIMGLLSSAISREAIRGLNPTMNFQIENIKMVPVLVDQEKKPEINRLVQENIRLAKRDYDLYERSWNFKKHGLLDYPGDLSQAMEAYGQAINTSFYQLKDNERRIRQIFNQIYDLEGQWQDLDLDFDITLSRLVEEKLPEDNSYVITRRQVVESLISYLVGCIFGRYESRLPRLQTGNILIFNQLDHPADILVQLKQALAIIFGQENFEKNYAYIAQALSDEKRPYDEIIRDYFIYKKGFYNEHNRIFQSRPIYFLFESGNKNGLKGIFYIHKYGGDELGLLADYYGKILEEKYLLELDQGISPRENQALLKELRSYRDFLGGKKIEIDLDDGIKFNYEKFQGLDYKGKKKNILSRLKL